MAKFPLQNLIFFMPKHLSLSTSTTQFSVSASSLTCSFKIDYLTNKCGLPLKSAIATSRKLRGIDENNLQRSDSVFSLLKSHGFDDAHISKMIQKFPNLLNQYEVEDNLKPTLEFLVENGFSGPHLHDLIVSCPEILAGSLSLEIKPSLEFLRSFLGTEERLILALKRNPLLLRNSLKATMQANINLLLKEDVPLDALRNLLASDPFRWQSKTDRLVSALKITKDLLKLRPADSKFLAAALMIASIGVPLWVKKLQVFKSFGFSQQQVFSIFKRYPGCFSRSEEKLRTKLGFYLNTVKLRRDDIIRYPLLLGFSIETRIRPRHNVLKLLMSKKLLQEDAKIAHKFTISENKFSSKYVLEHLQEVPGLLEMYNNDSNEEHGIQIS